MCVTCLEFECFVIDITMYELCGHIGATKHIVLDTRSCLFYRRLHQQTAARRQKGVQRNESVGGQQAEGTS